MGDSIVKNLNGYEILRMWPSKCKIDVVISLVLKRGEWKTIWSRRCVKTLTTLFYAWEQMIWIPNYLQNLLLNRLPILQPLLKNENHDVCISNTVVCTDNQQLRQKPLSISKEFSEIFRERKSHLIDNSRKIKQQHLSKCKLYLNQKGVTVLGGIYLREIRKILNWNETENFAGFEECMSEKSPISIDEIVDYKSILKSVRGGNKHKLVLAHMNLNSELKFNRK